MIRPTLATALFIVAPITASSCKTNVYTPTGIQLQIATTDPAIRPGRLEALWYEGSNPPSLIRVPTSGVLPADLDPVLVDISIDENLTTPRRVHVRGLQGGLLVAAAASRIEIGVGEWRGFHLDLIPAASLRDKDSDGIPDEIDDCPDIKDPCPPPGLDAGQQPPDGGLPDAADAAEVGDAEADGQTPDGAMPQPGRDAAPGDVRG